MVRPLAFARVHDGSKRRRDDNMFDRGSIFLDGFEDTSRSYDGRIKQVFLDIRSIEMKWGGGVYDCLKGWIRFHRIIKSALLRDILNYDEVEVALRGFWVRLFDLVGFLLRAYSRNDRVTASV